MYPILKMYPVNNRAPDNKTLRCSFYSFNIVHNDYTVITILTSKDRTNIEPEL